jgi:hypothetical protein
MGYFETYKSRLNANGGSEKDSVKNATIDVINKSFTSSLGHLVIKLNGVDTDAILVHSDKDAKKFLLFKHGAVTNKGDIALVEGENRLILDVIVNEIHPKAEIKSCNQTLTLKGTVTQVDTGEKDWRGDPIYETTEESTILVPCIVESKIYYNSTTEAINLPDGHVKVTIPFTEHGDIRMNGEIILYDETYQITDIDRTQSINKSGILILSAKRT